VQLLQAQELTAQKKLRRGVAPLESLAQEKGDGSWPHQQILFELDALTTI